MKKYKNMYCDVIRIIAKLQICVAVIYDTYMYFFVIFFLKQLLLNWVYLTISKVSKYNEQTGRRTVTDGLQYKDFVSPWNPKIFKDTKTATAKTFEGSFAAEP